MLPTNRSAMAFARGARTEAAGRDPKLGVAPARDLTAVGGDLHQRAEPGAERAPRRQPRAPHDSISGSSPATATPKFTACGSPPQCSDHLDSPRRGRWDRSDVTTTRATRLRCTRRCRPECADWGWTRRSPPSPACSRVRGRFTVRGCSPRWGRTRRRRELLVRGTGEGDEDGWHVEGGDQRVDLVGPGPALQRRRVLVDPRRRRFGRASPPSDGSRCGWRACWTLTWPPPAAHGPAFQRSSARVRPFHGRIVRSVPSRGASGARPVRPVAIGRRCRAGTGSPAAR